MGKKKSVVLTVLITIVIAIMCAISAVPSFHVSQIKKWLPATAQYDFDMELGGGYYTQYYPEGVISALEYNAVLEEKKEESNEAFEEYKESYVAHKGLYLSTDKDLDVVKYDTVSGKYVPTESFVTAFENAKALIEARFEARMYSSFKVSVVDDYVLKVEVPASDTAVGTVLPYFAYTGALDLNDGTDSKFADKDGERATDYIKSVKYMDRYGYSYIAFKLTKAGNDLFKTLTSDSSKVLAFKVGENAVLEDVSASYFQDYGGNTWILGMNNKETAESLAIVLNSSLNSNTTDNQTVFQTVASSDISSFESIYGEKATTFMFIAIAIAVVLALIVPIVMYKGYGVAVSYSVALYFGITAFCFAFISENVFEVSVGTAIVFLLGLVGTVILSCRVYKFIKNEFNSGKTVESAVKAGFKKTLLTTVDACALAVLISLALLIGTTGLNTVAIQALICFATMAFNALLFTRIMNFLLVSASKNKYKHFGFVREDDEDDE